MLLIFADISKHLLISALSDAFADENQIRISRTIHLPSMKLSALKLRELGGVGTFTYSAPPRNGFLKNPPPRIGLIRGIYRD